MNKLEINQALSNKQAIIFSVLFLLIFVYLFFPVAFYTSIFWDTKLFITENPNIADPSWNSLVNIWTFKAHPTEALYIPLFYTSFWIEKFLGFSENISHISNLLLHLINCFLAYKIMEYICKSFAVKYIVILLFAFHPMQVESVVWLMGRKDLLMTTFTFLSILCFLNNKMSQPALRYLLTSIFLTFALLCKPSVISIIPLFVIIECLRTKSIKKSSWTLILVFLGFAFYHIQQNNPYIFQGTGFKFYQAPYLTWHFISRFFLINSSEPMYLWYKRSASGVILGYILTLSIIGYILYSLKKKKWSENSMLFASTLFFVAPLHIYVISHRVFYTADRYYYTMLAPFSAFIVILLFKFKNKIIPVSISALFIVSNFFYTQKNVEYWKDSFTFWEHVLKENADSYFVNYRYARLLQRNGENELALKYFRKAHDISPTRSAPYIALINQLYLMEQFDEAMLKISQLEQYMPKNKELVRIKLSIYEDKYKKAKTHENYQQLYEYYLFLELTDKAEKLAKPSLTKEGQKDK